MNESLFTASERARHGWEGLADPDNDPEPTQFRVFRWWPRLKGYGFRADLPFAALIDAGAGLPSLRIEIADADGRPICDPTQAVLVVLRRRTGGGADSNG